MGYNQQDGYNTINTYVSIYHKYAQTFTASTTYDLARVTFPVTRSGGEEQPVMAMCPISYVESL